MLIWGWTYSHPIPSPVDLPQGWVGWGWVGPHTGAWSQVAASLPAGPGNSGFKAERTNDSSLGPHCSAGERETPSCLCVSLEGRTTRPGYRRVLHPFGAPQKGGVWHEAMVLVCLLLAPPIGLSPLHIPTLSGSERVLVVSMEPLDDLSCLTTPGSAVPETGCFSCR